MIIFLFFKMRLLKFLFASIICYYSSSSSTYPFRMLAIIAAILILSAEALNSPVVVVANHVLRFFSHDILLLPTPLLPGILPCRTSCSSPYLSSCLIICPRYLSFRILIVSINSIFLFILSKTLLLVHVLPMKSSVFADIRTSQRIVSSC